MALECRQITIALDELGSLTTVQGAGAQPRMGMPGAAVAGQEWRLRRALAWPLTAVYVIHAQLSVLHGIFCPERCNNPAHLAYMFFLQLLGLGCVGS